MKLSEPPVSDDNSSSTYVYFPDPKDGSLYMSDINGEGFKVPPDVKKLSANYWYCLEAAIEYT